MDIGKGPGEGIQGFGGGLHLGVQAAELHAGVHIPGLLGSILPIGCYPDLVLVNVRRQQVGRLHLQAPGSCLDVAVPVSALVNNLQGIRQLLAEDLAIAAAQVVVAQPADNPFPELHG